MSELIALLAGQFAVSLLMGLAAAVPLPVGAPSGLLQDVEAVKHQVLGSEGIDDGDEPAAGERTGADVGVREHDRTRGPVEEYAGGEIRAYRGIVNRWLLVVYADPGRVGRLLPGPLLGRARPGAGPMIGVRLLLALAVLNLLVLLERRPLQRPGRLLPLVRCGVRRPSCSASRCWRSGSSSPAPSIFFVWVIVLTLKK